MKTISTALKSILNNRAGIPAFRVSVYDTNFAYPSKGLEGKYYSYNYSGQVTDYLNEEGALRGQDNEIIWIYGNNYTSGRLLRTQYDSHIMFNWGDNPPLGILPDQLENEYSYAAKWSGLFYANKPGKYYFAYVSTSLASIRVNGITVMEPGIAHQIAKARDENNDLLKRRPVTVTRPMFLPVKLFFSRQRYPSAGRNPKHKVKERFVCFWKHDDDTDWKVLDCSQVIHGLDVTNTSGSPITNVEVVESGRFDTDDRFDFELQSSGINDSYGVYINGVNKGYTGADETHEYKVNDAEIKVTFSGQLADNDKATIWGPRFLQPLVSVHGLPLVKSIQENRTEGQSTTYSFAVPLTPQPFDKNNISSTNCYSYNIETESYGVLRKNRLVDIYQGYKTSDDESLYHRFRGFIDEVQTEHQATEALLTINCRDVSKLCIDGRITSLPDQLSYDIANITPSNVNITQADGNIRPVAYDGWKTVQVIRDLGYNAGLTSAQLFAETSSGQFLIEDLDDHLDTTGMYPFTRQVLVDGTTIEAEYMWKSGLGDTYWDQMHKIANLLGRQLNITLDGNLEFRAPDNPVVVANYTINDDVNSIEFNDSFHGPIVASTDGNSARCLKGFYYTVAQGHPLPGRFNGTGISLVIARVSSDDVQIRVEIDGILVDGKNQLDSTTADIGNTAYITKLDNDGYYNLQISNLGTNYWHYLDGVHPVTNNNPSVIPICSNLTSGKHTVKIYAKADIIKVEGIFVYQRNDHVPVHSFSGNKDKISLSAKEDMESMRNDILVLGARVGPVPVHARATDIASVKDPDAPNYIGYLRTAILIIPELRNKERANFIALNTLTRYSQNSRVVSVNTVGLPFLEIFDPVSIDNTKFGFNLPAQIETSAVVNYVNIVRERQDRFWITGVSSSQSHNSYTATVETTPYPPQRAYQPVPDPPNSLYDTMYTNISITVDGAVSNTYNPFNGDRDGEFVDVEFDLMYNASMVKISAVVTNTVTYTCPFDGTNKVTLRREDMVNVLKYEEGLVPRGHYKLFWDGWWSTGDNTGRYVLHTSTVAFRFEAVRYSDKKAFATLDTGHLIASSPYYDDIKQYSNITMNYDRSVFTASTSISTLARSTAADGVTYDNDIDAFIYDDEQSQPNNTGQLKITVKNGIPGAVHVKFRVMCLQKVNIGGDVHLVYDEIVTVAQDDEPRDVGEYDFFFNPSIMIPPSGLMDTSWTRINPTVWKKGRGGQYYISSEDRLTTFAQENQSSVSNIPFNYKGLDLPNANDVLYSCWLIRASSVQLTGGGAIDTVYYQFPETGMYVVDKSLYYHGGFSTITNPNYFVWMGNYQKFSTYSNTAVSRDIFPEDLKISMRDDENIFVLDLPFVQVT